jgi:hypothetical protein
MKKTCRVFYTGCVEGGLGMGPLGDASKERGRLLLTWKL